jgi:hypothetical protein
VLHAFIIRRVDGNIFSVLSMLSHECTVCIILLEFVTGRRECSKVSVLSLCCMDCVRLCGEYKPNEYK